MSARDRLPRPDRKRLPFEDVEESLYLHDREGLLRIGDEGSDEPDRFYLPVERFMAVQRERDAYRKALALINATLSDHVELRATETAAVRAVLRGAGLTLEDARAIRELLNWAQAETYNPPDRKD